MDYPQNKNDNQSISQKIRGVVGQRSGDGVEDPGQKPPAQKKHAPILTHIDEVMEAAGMEGAGREGDMYDDFIKWAEKNGAKWPKLAFIKSSPDDCNSYAHFKVVEDV